MFFRCICVWLYLCVGVIPGQHPARTRPTDFEIPGKPPHLPMHTRMCVYMGIIINMSDMRHDVNELT